jgi:hypothetical protein
MSGDEIKWDMVGPRSSNRESKVFPIVTLVTALMVDERNMRKGHWWNDSEG